MAILSANFRSMRKALLTVAAIIVTVVAIGLTLFPACLAPAGVHVALPPAGTREAPALPFHPYGDALPAKGKFLVASRAIADPRFQEAVVLLIECNDAGATGLIINRPSKVPLTQMLMPLPGLEKRSDVVYYGGPVEGHRFLMLIRSPERLETADMVFTNVYVSASRNMLERMIAAHKTQKQLHVYAGYAGWLPGQLDREVSRGDWYILNADADSIFEKESSDIWRELILRGSAIDVWKQDDTERSTFQICCEERDSRT
jgi:putative transcriptional regulator